MAINYTSGITYICFIGTHQDYDKIDIATIEEDIAISIRPIHTEAEYEAMLAEIKRLFDAAPHTPE